MLSRHGPPNGEECQVGALAPPKKGEVTRSVPGNKIGTWNSATPCSEYDNLLPGPSNGYPGWTTLHLGISKRDTHWTRRLAATLASERSQRSRPEAIVLSAAQAAKPRVEVKARLLSSEFSGAYACERKGCSPTQGVMPKSGKSRVVLMRMQGFKPTSLPGVQS